MEANVEKKIGVSPKDIAVLRCVRAGIFQMTELRLMKDSIFAVVSAVIDSDFGEDAITKDEVNKLYFLYRFLSNLEAINENFRGQNAYVNPEIDFYPQSLDELEKQYQGLEFVCKSQEKIMEKQAKEIEELKKALAEKEVKND